GRVQIEDIARSQRAPAIALPRIEDSVRHLANEGGATGCARRVGEPAVDVGDDVDCSEWVVDADLTVGSDADHDAVCPRLTRAEIEVGRHRAVGSGRPDSQIAGPGRPGDS